MYMYLYDSAVLFGVEFLIIQAQNCKILLHRLSKHQSLSTATVLLFRTTFTWTIKLNLLLKYMYRCAFSRNSMRLLFLSFLAGNIVFDVFLSLFFFFDCLFFLICQIKRVKDADEVPMVCKCFYVLAFCFISLGKFLWESYSTLLYFCCNKNSQ